MSRRKISDNDLLAADLERKIKDGRYAGTALRQAERELAWRRERGAVADQATTDERDRLDGRKGRRR